MPNKKTTAGVAPPAGKEYMKDQRPVFIKLPSPVFARLEKKAREERRKPGPMAAILVERCLDIEAKAKLLESAR